MFTRAFFPVLTAKNGTKCRVKERPSTWGTSFCNIVENHSGYVIVAYDKGLAAVPPESLEVCTEGSLVLGTTAPIVQPFLVEPDTTQLKELIDDPAIPRAYLIMPTKITKDGTWRM